MKKIIKELYPYVIIILVVVLVRTFIITPVRVDGDSMRKNLNDGEILLLYKLAKIDRYDIVVIEDKENETIIKRVYGMPGDTVEIKNNKIYINDEIIEDEFNYGETSDVEKIQLEEDEYFVLGDNRLISKDSRALGPITKDEIKGVTIVRLFPFTKIDTL